MSEIELPDQLPTAAVIAAFKHAVDHTHNGVDIGHHFIGALLEELGLLQRGPAQTVKQNALPSRPGEVD